jgi:hypothetical protein
MVLAVLARHRRGESFVLKIRLRHFASLRFMENAPCRGSDCSILCADALRFMCFEASFALFSAAVSFPRGSGDSFPLLSSHLPCTGCLRGSRGDAEFKEIIIIILAKI